MDIEKDKESEKIKDSQFAIIYESQKNIKFVRLVAGQKFQSQEGAYRYINMIGQQWGSKVSAINKPTQCVHCLKPKSTLITQTLSRKTQILYSMDNSAVLFKLNIKVGDIIVQAGTGSGSLSCAISETIGDSGHLYTFQFNKERAQITKQFFQNLQKKNITSTWRDVVANGFQVQGKYFKADGLFLDVPNPWSAITHAKNILKKHGRICCFSPCIEQVQKTCLQLKKQKFKKIQTIECISREFEIDDKEIKLEGIQKGKRISSCTRAVHTNKGHTGYLTFAISC